MWGGELFQILFHHRPELRIIHIAFHKICADAKHLTFLPARFVAQIGTDDDREGQLLLLLMLENPVAIDMRQEQIKQEQVRRVCIDYINRFFPITSTAHADILRSQNLFHHLPEKDVIFGNENVLLFLAHREWGKERENVVPLCSCEVKEIVPPKSCTSE